MNTVGILIVFFIFYFLFFCNFVIMGNHSSTNNNNDDNENIDLNDVDVTDLINTKNDYYEKEICIIGDSGVGKTNLINKLFDKDLELMIQL